MKAKAAYSIAVLSFLCEKVFFSASIFLTLSPPKNKCISLFCQKLSIFYFAFTILSENLPRLGKFYLSCDILVLLLHGF